MRIPRIIIAAGLTLVLLAASAAASPVGSAFTYQGRIDRSGIAVTDLYTIIFRLYDASSAGAQIGTDQVMAVNATNGLFQVLLDFGASPFTGQARWLDMSVRGSADGSFTHLATRQPLTPVPYALYALNAGTPGTSQWISDGFGNITYAGGAAGITGQSTHTATGKGVFFDGGNASFAQVYGYNYDISQGITLYLNAPGGSVAVGSVAAPAAKLDVLASGGQGILATTKGSTFFGTNAAVRAVGNTGTGASGTTSMGVYATSTDDRAVAGFSTNSWGVSGDCTSAGTFGILGTPSEGVYGFSPNAAKPAAHFANSAVGGVALWADGLAKVKTLQILGADLAESFPVEGGSAEPGTVLAISGRGEGTLRVCAEAYSRRVAGVVSGANGLDAAVVLKGRSFDTAEHATVALSGRVWVKCDATGAAIHVGDLLTTASRAGHAMVANDRERAQGAILGKAMTSLETGTGMVLVLVSLQ